MSNHSERFINFIERNSDLFWHFDKKKLSNLSDAVVVKYILNFGDESTVKELIDILGVNKTAEIFFKNTEGKDRKNYFPQVENFFRLYFSRHAHRNT
jgi:hypothetical protein